MSASDRNIRSLIGGRWAISIAGYLVLAPISGVWIYTTVPEAFLRTDGIGTGVFVAVTSYLVTGVVLLLASATVFKNRRTRPVPILAVVAVGALAWGARSGYLAWFLDAFDLPSEASPLSRIATGSLLGAVIVPASAWALALLDEFRSTRRQLLDDLVAQELRVEKSATYIDAMRSTVISEVQTVVDQAFAQADEADTEPTIVVDRLAQRMARDLPRTLWHQARKESSIKPGMILRIALRRPMAIWPIIPMAILGTLVSIRFLPANVSILAMAAAMLWVALVVAVVNRRARGRNSVTPLLLGCIGLMGSGVIFAVVASIIAPDAPGVISIAVSISVTFSLFVVGGGIAHALNIAEKSVLSQLEESISRAEVHAVMLDREESRLLREIAATLHGTVGASLTATSMRLRSAIDSGNTLIAVNALHEARRLVDVQLASVHVDQLADPVVLIDRIAESWIGLVTIHGDVQVTGQLTPAVMRALDDVITEGINNAVRHARARTISVHILQVASDLVIHVSDDGDREQRSRPGL